MTTLETTEINNSEDLIDIRDVIARIEHLEGLEQSGPIDLGDDNDTPQDELFEELHQLRALMDECKGNGGDEQYHGDWYPLTLIRETYLEDYVRETADDLYGDEMCASHWPFNCIDWERATIEFRQDYTEIDFDGVSYLVR